MQNWQSGRAVEAGGGQVEIVAVADNIRIGIVGVEDRIAVGAITGIGHPGKAERGRHDSWFGWMQAGGGFKPSGGSPARRGR